MIKVQLAGVNALGEVVKLSKDVREFVDAKNKFSVRIIDASQLVLTTSKGSYSLQKHPTLNIYQGPCNGFKVQISLQKVVGWIGYWIPSSK